jgi:hypothetical protein
VEIQVFQTGKPCCGGVSSSNTLILDRSVSRDMLTALLDLGTYVEAKHMTKAGVLYVESKMLILQGSFGRNRLQAKCKSIVPAHTEECVKQLDIAMGVLKSMP